MNIHWETTLRTYCEDDQDPILPPVKLIPLAKVQGKGLFKKLKRKNSFSIYFQVIYI